MILSEAKPMQKKLMKQLCSICNLFEDDRGESPNPCTTLTESGDRKIANLKWVVIDTLEGIEKTLLRSRLCFKVD